MRLCFLILFIISILLDVAFAEKIFFKIAVDDKHYSIFEYSDTNNIVDEIHFVLGKFQTNIFELNKIKKDFYNILKRPDIKYDGKKLNVYELSPILKDRFVNVLWVCENLVVRKEVYDLNGKLLYSYGHSLSIPDNFNDIFVKNSEVQEHMDNNTITYKGFDLKLLKKLDNNSLHMLFSDGLNNFSIFITTPPINSSEIKKIVFGNYVFSKNYDNSTYTVVGTIPFEEMENAINFVKKVSLDKLGGK